MEAFIWVYLFVAIAVNAGFSAIVAYVAKQKGRSSSGFFWLSFFLSFLVGILVVLAIPKREDQVVASNNSSFTISSSGEELVKCPFCAEWVKAEAKICKFCNSEIEQAINEYRRAELEAKNTAKRKEEEESQKLLELQKKQKQQKQQDMRKFLRSRKFFIGLGVVVVTAIFASVFTAIAIGEQQKQEQIALDIEKQKQQKEEQAQNDWSYALSTCDETFPNGVQDSGTVLSGDGNSISIQKAEGSNTGFVSCILKTVVEDPKVIDFYRDRDSQLSSYFGEPLPLAGNTQVVIQRGTNGAYIGEIVISK